MSTITTGPGATRIDMGAAKNGGYSGQKTRPVINKFGPADRDKRAEANAGIAAGEAEKARVTAEAEQSQRQNLKDNPWTS